MVLGWEQEGEVEDGREKREINWKNKKKPPGPNHHCNPDVSLDPGGLFPQKAPLKAAQFLPQDDVSTNRCLHPLKSKRYLFYLPPWSIKFISSCSSRILSWQLLVLRNISLSSLERNVGNTHRNPKGSWLIIPGKQWDYRDHKSFHLISHLLSPPITNSKTTNRSKMTHGLSLINGNHL